jgi:hypothetical protein
MAKLFLSYSRKDDSAARRLTKWLEREGHDVWRDEDDIGGGASFSAEIEKALNECDAVLVLWSVESVRSAWVRDEAGYGRDAGKLIPFSLDGTEPPLGFRQYQAISLARWKHGEPPVADRIRDAIARIGSLPAPHPKPVEAGPARQLPLGWPVLIGGGVALLIAAVMAVVLWQPWASERQIAIAVVPSPQSPDRTMAADYANAAAADMAAFLPRRFDRATVIAPADAASGASGYRMAISTDPHGAGADATLTLSDEDGHTTLWSQNWAVADVAGADLKAQISTAASKAAVCLTESRGGRRRLSQPALGLYLTGCTALGGTKLSNEDFVTIFERVTKLDPDFGPGWDYLALSRSWVASGLEGSSPAAYSAALRSARDAIAVARRLNPNSAMSYDAEYHLITRDTYHGLEVLSEGAKIDPDDGRIQMHLSEVMLAVGRMLDSVAAAQRGIELQPDSAYTRYQYISALVYSGQFSRAKTEIADARKKWPKDFVIDLGDFHYQFLHGDPRAALELLPKIVHSGDADMAPPRKVIEARLDPSPAKIDAAIAALRERASTDPSSLLPALGYFGRLDEAYQLLEDPRLQPSIDTSLLFRPEFAGVRADPRFMQVAAQLRLVHYWRQSGYWPDFCSTEQLNYDCKKEAAKYPG